MVRMTGTAATTRASDSTRWQELVFCIVCMVMIANLQYGWTLFVNPINKSYGWSIASIQFAFALFSVPAPKVVQSARSFTPKEVLSAPVFWLLYVMFVMVSASGLMATAQIAPISGDFNVGNSIVFFGATALTAALIIDNLANGAARPIFGWISDRIGREFTMAIAFGVGGVSYWLLGSLGTVPWAFILFAALIFLTWGEIFSLFPSTCTDSFGVRFATVNLSLLYTAKGTSAFLVPVANIIRTATGSWHVVFVVTTSMNFVVVGLDLFVLKPMRRRLMNQNGDYAGHVARDATLNYSKGLAQAWDATIRHSSEGSVRSRRHW